MLRIIRCFECPTICHAVAIAILATAFSGTAAAQQKPDQNSTLREYQGTVEAVQKFVFSARFDGLLSKINFEPGQVVEKGEIVLEFAPTARMLALERSRAQRLSAEAEHRNAEMVLERYRKLGKTDSIARNRIEDAEVARDVSAAKLQEARANEKLAEVVLSQMQLQAPFKGIMSPPFVPVGTFLDLQSRTTKPLAEIVQMDPIRVVARVPYNVFLERRLAAKSEKETLERATWTLVLPSGDIYPHPGRLISADYELDRDTQTLATWAEFPNPDYLLRPGLKVKVQSRLRDK